MAAKKKDRTFAERLKDARFTDKHLEAHQSLAQEDGVAWRAAVLERDGFAEAAKGGATSLMAWMLEAGLSPDVRPSDKARVRLTPPALMQVRVARGRERGGARAPGVERLAAIEPRDALAVGSTQVDHTV